MKKIWLIIAGIVLLLGAYVAMVYNTMVTREEQVNKTFSELQATYQRRLDLLPNLVNVVKANAAFEQNLLEQVAVARSLAMQVTQTALPVGDDFREMEQAQASLATAANRLVAVVENYPALRATDAYFTLQSQIEGTERRIRLARNDFNEAVQLYNQRARAFPAKLFTGMLGFDLMEGFQATAGAEKVPEIKF